MIRAFIAGIIVAGMAPLIGMFLVVRRFSYMADTLAHVSLVGVALGVLLNVNPVIAAIIFALVSAFFIERLRAYKRISGESVLSLFLFGGLAVSLVMLSLSNGFNVDLLSYLFGAIATVTSFDIIIISILSLAVIIIVARFYKEFLLLSFDEDLAKVQGVKIHTLNLVLIMLSAITVALAMRIVGLLLIGALMVIPSITAMLYKKGFFNTMILAITLSVASAVLGLFFSYYFDIASGGSIVLIAVVFFIASLIITRGVKS